MSLTQESLRFRVARRIAGARPDLAERLDLTTAPGLLAAQEEITGAAPDEGVLAVAVLRRFDLADWIRGTCSFAQGLEPPARAAWRASFTRTVFLAGNPENLTGRFAFGHVTPDRSAAWAGPAPAAATGGLRRLLKTFDGSGAPPATATGVIVVPGGPGATDRGAVEHTVHLATAGVTVAGLLVHLNHLLAEAVLDQVLVPGDRLTVRQAPYLAGVREPFTALRVATDPAGPDRLRAFAGLTCPERA